MCVSSETGVCSLVFGRSPEGSDHDASGLGCAPHSSEVAAGLRRTAPHLLKEVLHDAGDILGECLHATGRAAASC